MLSYNDAKCYEIMLSLKLCDESEYDAALNKCLNEESPLSDITLELSFCGSDIDKTISSLHRYADGKADDDAVCAMLRQRLRLMLDQGKIDADKCFDLMSDAVDCFGTGKGVWENMEITVDIYDEFAEYFIEDFWKEELQKYLSDGTPLRYDGIKSNIKNEYKINDIYKAKSKKYTVLTVIWGVSIVLKYGAIIVIDTFFHELSESLWFEITAVATIWFDVVIALLLLFHDTKGRSNERKKSI